MALDIITDRVTVMKRKLAITAIVALAIGFVGLADGFTKTVAVRIGFPYVCRNAEGIKVVNPDDPSGSQMAYKDGWSWWLDEDGLPQDGWCGEYAQRKYGYTLNKEPYENPCPFTKAEGYTKAEERRNCDYKKEFDPRSTAMFAIGGVIIGLLPLTRKKGR